MRKFVQRLIVAKCPNARGVLKHYITDNDDPPKVIRIISHHTGTKTRMVQVGAKWLSEAIQSEAMRYDGLLMDQIQLGKTLFDTWSELAQ